MYCKVLQVMLQHIELESYYIHTEMAREGREVVFIWVPGHVGIRGNSAADSAEKIFNFLKEINIFGKI